MLIRMAVVVVALPMSSCCLSSSVEPVPHTMWADCWPDADMDLGAPVAVLEQLQVVLAEDLRDAATETGSNGDAPEFGPRHLRLGFPANPVELEELPVAEPGGDTRPLRLSFSRSEFAEPERWLDAMTRLWLANLGDGDTNGPAGW